MDTKDENKIEAESNEVMQDTEAGLELPDSVPAEEMFLDEDEALRVEFETSIKNTAEERANTPFGIAAMTHARMIHPALAEIDRVSGGAAKRVLKYLIAYPFYVKELNAQDKQVEALAQVCDKLVQTKFTMAMCQAIEKEARITKAVQEQEDLIAEVPDDVPVAGSITKEVLEEGAEVAANKVGQVE